MNIGERTSRKFGEVRKEFIPIVIAKANNPPQNNDILVDFFILVYF